MSSQRMLERFVALWEIPSSTGRSCSRLGAILAARPPRVGVALVFTVAESGRTPGSGRSGSGGCRIEAAARAVHVDRAEAMMLEMVGACTACRGAAAGLPRPAPLTR